MPIGLKLREALARRRCRNVIRRHRTLGWLQPESFHEYAGYRGPWLEEAFFAHWVCRGKPENHRRYLPVFWTSVYRQRGATIEPVAEIQKFIDDTLDPSLSYFTVVQNGKGILEKVPPNLLVFSAGGKGDVPVPLIKSDLRCLLPHGTRDLLCSYMGNDRAHRARRRMRDTLWGKPGFYFGEGDFDRFVKIVGRSVFTLCPRGVNPSSFRIHEALALGSIPIYVWEDVEWLPWRDAIAWDRIGLSLPVAEIATLPERLRAMPEAEIRRKQAAIAEIYDDYFSYEGICRQILTRTSCSSR